MGAEEKPVMDKAHRNALSVVFAGVGGQGVLTASEALARAALIGGMDVKKSEVHGMAQRGGSVFSHVRFGGIVHSPLIPAGTADFLVAFEGIEALRFAHQVKPGGAVILNRLEIPPMPGTVPRHVDAEGRLSLMDVVVVPVPAQELAEEAGDIRAAGSVLLGALSGFIALAPPCWEGAFMETFRPRAAEINKAAFRLGRSFVSTARK